MSPRVCFRVALKALSKNKLQTGLTMLGLIIGVATVLTMFALGSGAQTAIETQVKAAGMNIITVTSGNHMGTVEDDTQNQPGGGDGSEAEMDMDKSSAAPESAQIPSITGSQPTTAAGDPLPVVTAKKDSRSAAERLGDPEADLGIPAKLALGDAADIRKMAGVQYVSEGLHTNV